MVYRVLAGLLLLAALALSATFRARARRVSGTIPRADEPTPLILARVAFTLPLLLLLLAEIFVPRVTVWAHLAIPAWLRIFAAVLGAASIVLLWWVLRSIGSNISETVLTKPNHQLVTHGPYRWVRHPLYSAGSLLLLALATLTASAPLLVLSLLAPVLIRILVVPSEERALERAFPQRYSAYRLRTGALWPRLLRR